MSADEAEVVDYIDTLLGDAPVAAAVASGAAAAPEPVSGPAAGADPGQATGTAEPEAGPSAVDPGTAMPPTTSATTDAEAGGALPPADPPATPGLSDASVAPDPPESMDAPGAGDATGGSNPLGAPAALVAPAMPAAPAAPVAPPRARPSVQAEPPPTPTHASHAPRWLRVVVGGASYALELLRVQEVVRLMPIVPMRGAQPAVLGVMNLRGRIVPVFDLGLWLGTGQVQAGEQSRIVVVERDDELIGLLVSAVDDVVTLGRDRIEPPLAGDGRGVVLGVARVGEVPTVLFDAYALYG